MKALGRFGRRAAPPGTRRRRWLFLGTLAVSVAALAGFLISNALAVHDEAFQLDGDVSASTTTNFGGQTQPYDWDSFFDSSGGKITPLPAGFAASGFDRDFAVNADGTYNTSDSTTYTQGSKDTNNISSNWVCAVANNVTNKGDIQNDYAVAYTDPVTGHQFLYFALERNSNSGDANVAFWFLQDPNANCSTANGTSPWTGNHQDGDVLIVSAFTKGGGVSTVTAYRWNGGAGGSLGTTPIVGGGDCSSSTQSLGDPICATANKANIKIPWLTDNNGKTTGLGHTLLTGEFYEGGIDLTQTNLAGKCFNTFVGDTRSSQELGATLYDFARGTLGECHSSIQTTPTPAAGSSTTIPANAQVTSSDSALLKVDGVPKFSGTVTFSLCGPLALNSTSNCQTGGTSIGSATTLTDVTSPHTVTSDSVTLTKVGRYCWRANYSGDSARGVPPSSDPSDANTTTECFTITPRTPTLVTCADGTARPCVPDGTVDFGSAVRDTADLSATANQPGTGGIGDGSINPTGGNGKAQGSITFTLYKSDCTTLATGTGTNPQTVTVSGDKTYGPVSFTPDTPGLYHWVATYSGDPPNTNPSDPKADDATCGADANEDVTVRQIPTAIVTKQRWFPNDTATIVSTVSGNNIGAGGTVDFTLYNDASCGGGAGTAQYAEEQTLAGGSHQEQVSTHNYTGSSATKPGGGAVSPFEITTLYGDPPGSPTGSYSWKVVYTPSASDTAHLGTSSSCTAGGTENFSTTYTNDNSGAGFENPPLP